MRAASYIGAARRVGNPRYRKAVITVHGLKTTGAWQKVVNAPLSDADIRHIPVDYGYRLLPGSTHRVLRRIMHAYDDHRAHDDRLRISVIAHSFGTLGFGRTLQRQPAIRFERAILYGSVLPKDFDWSNVREEEQVRKVLHETCPSDWIVYCAGLLPHAGSSGCTGFTDLADGLVEQRTYSYTGHAALGTVLHCEKVWIPFLLNGTLTPKRPKPFAKLAEPSQRPTSE